MKIKWCHSAEKSSDDDDDDKHKDEYGKKKHRHHDDHLNKTFRHVRDVLEDPPSTWAAYEDDKLSGLWKVIEMEYGEAKKAHEALKAGIGTRKDLHHEICHVIAAATHAYTKMSCEDEK